MKLTYANVMSTIAMFAALTTGGAYAATKLAANSVGTVQIRNGQVTLADLHPSVRKRLGTASNPTTGTPTPTGGWTIYKTTADTLFPSGEKYAVDGKLPATNVQLRVRGTLKNVGNEPVDWIIEVGKGMNHYQCVASASIPAGGSVSLDACGEAGTVFNANNRPDYVKVTAASPEGTAEADARVARSIQGQVRIDWK